MRKIKYEYVKQMSDANDTIENLINSIDIDKNRCEITLLGYDEMNEKTLKKFKNDYWEMDKKYQRLKMMYNFLKDIMVSEIFDD